MNTNVKEQISIKTMALIAIFSAITCILAPLSIPLTIIAGIFIEKFYSKWYLCLIGMILGTAVCYAFGTAWLAYEAHMDFKTALWAGVIPFIPGDLIKMLLAMIAGPVLKKTLLRARIL